MHTKEKQRERVLRLCETKCGQYGLIGNELKVKLFPKDEHNKHKQKNYQRSTQREKMKQ